MPRSAPLRFLVLWMAALMVVAAMASSSVRAAALGRAAVQSALGQPLRVTIPLDAARRETIAADCFSLVRPTGDGPAAIVTAKVSLERTAAASRVVVTTREPINEPAIRLALQGGCDGATPRDYVLLLDRAQAGSAHETSAATAGSSAPATRAPGQEPPAAALTAAVRRDSPERSGTGQRVAQRSVGADASLRSPSAGTESSALERMPATPASLRSGLMPVANAGDKVRVPLSVPRIERPASDSQDDIGWTIAVAGGGLLAIILGAILVRHGRAAPVAPEWSQLSATSTGPQSVTNLAAVPVTLSRGARTDSSQPPNVAVTLPNLTMRSRTRSISPAPRSVAKPAPASLTQASSDALLDDIEADLIELRAVREAHDAGRRDRQDHGGEAILQAIEAAERDLMLDSPAAADASMERSLEDELQVPQHRPRKAAA